ncbi:MAG: hypothetical protein JST93_17325 [Acidobacteria bacterium]|nr:hypothetical protein [Acidobacteriota bacterium]
MEQRVTSYVLTPGGTPIANAVIEVGGRTVATTDRSGYFDFRIAEPSKRTGITVIARGYMTNTRVVGTRSRAMAPVILVPVRNRATVENREGGTLIFNRSRLTIPPNAFRTEQGRPINGPVRIEYTLLDVTNRLDLSASMGDFTGRMLDGGIRNLRSFGIFQIRAFDRQGRPAELARGASIRFAIEVPERLRRSAPRETGLFSFERNEGRWIQEGTASLSGGEGEPLVYNGTIDRIDWGWNLDDSNTITCVTVKVVDHYGNPLDNMHVTATGSSYSSSGMTNGDGLVCLLVQRNDTITIGAWGTVGQSWWQVAQQNEPTVVVPDIASDAGDCGDREKCPLVATAVAWLIVHIVQRGVAAAELVSIDVGNQAQR